MFRFPDKYDFPLLPLLRTITSEVNYHFLGFALSIFDQQAFVFIFKYYSTCLDISIAVYNWKESIFTHQPLHPNPC